MCIGSRVAAGGAKRRTVLAHRLSWELAAGPVPTGLHVLHRCDNRLCCNPAHLFLGDQAANMADMLAKGRQSRGEKHSSALGHGERHHNAKLKDADVPEICRLRAAGESQAAIGKRFGVSQSAISLILLGKAWAHTTLRGERCA